MAGMEPHAAENESTRLYPEDPVAVQKQIITVATAAEPKEKLADSANRDARWYAEVDHIEHIYPLYETERGSFSSDSLCLIDFSGWTVTGDNSHLNDNERMSARLGFWYEYLERWKQLRGLMLVLTDTYNTPSHETEEEMIS